MEKFKKFVSYPMLLFGVISLLSIKGIFTQIIGLFKLPFTVPPAFLIRSIPSALLDVAVSIIPLVFVVLLVLNKLQKAENAKMIIGKIAFLGGCVTLVSWLLAVISFFRNPEFIEDLYYFLRSPWINLVSELVKGIVLVFVGYGLVSKKGMYPRFKRVFGICIVVLALSSLFAGVGGVGYTLSGLKALVFLIGLWYLPKVFSENPESADINKNKIVVLLVVLGLILGMLFIGMASASEGSSGSTSTNTCASCKRTFNAGDMGGNYMNIARTGMCNNCERNFHDLEWILDK